MNRMVWIVTMVVFAGASMPQTARAALVIGVFDETRAGVTNLMTGTYAEDAVASLNAHFPGTALVAAPTLTPEFLSGVDMVVLTSAQSGSRPFTPLSTSEQSALVDFVNAGGGALLVAEGHYPFIDASQSLVGPFGVTIEDDGITGIIFAEYDVVSHPVIDGPFGTGIGVFVHGSGIFTDFGPYATSLASMVVTGESVLAVIESGALSPTSGRVVMIADSTPFIDYDESGYFGLHEPLFLNTINYLATPEPSTLVLAGIACAFALVGQHYWTKQ